MASYSKMHALVKIIDSTTKLTAKDEIMRQLTDEPHLRMLRYPKTKEVIEQFKQQSNIPEHLAEQVLEEAIAHGFVEELPINLPNQDTHIKVTPKEGQDLVYTLWGLPVGQWRIVMNYYAPYSLIISVIALIIAAIALFTG